MFLAPAMLAGLLAIAVPIWLHRLAKANPTRHPFASLMFLQASETQRTARRTLRYWLLLALRVAFLVLLVLAFAGPLLSPDAASIAPDARLHAIVVDRSLSMNYGDRWRRVQGTVDTVVAEARPGDQLTLVAASGRRFEVLHDRLPLRDAGVLRATLQKLEPSEERLDYGLLMTTASSWLTTPRLPTRLHLVTDMQQSASPLRFADLQPPAATQIHFHDVGDVSPANTFIAAMNFTGDASAAVKIGATAQPTLQQSVVLNVDGKEVARKPVEFPPRAGHAPLQGEGVSATPDNATREVEVQFTGLALADGAHRVIASLAPGDGFAADDRLFTLLEQSRPRVLLVSRGSNSDEAAYFTAAIGSLTSPRLSIEQQPAEALTGRRLNGAALVVEADVSTLTSEALLALDEYVAGGGSVLMTLASGSAARQTRLLAGLRIGEVVTAATRITQVQASHPVLRDSGDWHRIRFFRHLRVMAAADDKVLVALEDGSPLLIERQIGAGRVLLLAAPLDRTWNDLAIHPLFIRFIADAARYLIGQNAARSEALVGAPVLTGLTADAGGQIFDPSGKRVLALAAATPADRFVPTQAGFYEVRSNAGQRWIAVNVDRRESLLDRMPMAVLQRWLALRPQASAVASEVTPGLPLQRSLGYPLLLLAALLCLAELLVANHYLGVRRDARVTS
ncbi:MAG: BatA and WFA domain-containing protein [Steroidobacteraceae bacterium]